LDAIEAAALQLDAPAELGLPRRGKTASNPFWRYVLLDAEIGSQLVDRPEFDSLASNWLISPLQNILRRRLAWNP